MLLDLGVWWGYLQVGESTKSLEQKINWVAVEITRLDQNEKEVDSLNIFKEQH